MYSANQVALLRSQVIYLRESLARGNYFFPLCYLRMRMWYIRENLARGELLFESLTLVLALIL